VELDHRLRELWLKHPRAVLVPHHPSFVKKIMLGLASLETIVGDLSSSQLPRAHASLALNDLT
jgi:hypothetical protein